jgi:hypothetical protein
MAMRAGIPPSSMACAMASRFVPDPEASTAMLIFFSMEDKRHLSNIPTD